MDKAKKTLTDDFTYNTKGRFGFTRVKSIKFKRIVWRFIASKPYASQSQKTWHPDYTVFI